MDMRVMAARAGHEADAAPSTGCRGNSSLSAYPALLTTSKARTRSSYAEWATKAGYGIQTSVREMPDTCVVPCGNPGTICAASYMYNTVRSNIALELRDQFITGSATYHWAESL